MKKQSILEHIVDAAANDFIKQVERENQEKAASKAVCSRIGHDVVQRLSHGTWWNECTRCDWGEMCSPD